MMWFVALLITLLYYAYCSIYFCLQQVHRYRLLHSACPSSSAGQASATLLCSSYSSCWTILGVLPIISSG